MGYHEEQKRKKLRELIIGLSIALLSAFVYIIVARWLFVNSDSLTETFGDPLTLASMVVWIAGIPIATFIILVNWLD